MVLQNPNPPLSLGSQRHSLPRFDGPYAKNIATINQLMISIENYLQKPCLFLQSLKEITTRLQNIEYDLIELMSNALEPPQSGLRTPLLAESKSGESISPFELLDKVKTLKAKAKLLLAEATLDIHSVQSRKHYKISKTEEKTNHAKNRNFQFFGSQGVSADLVEAFAKFLTIHEMLRLSVSSKFLYTVFQEIMLQRQCIFISEINNSTLLLNTRCLAIESKYEDYFKLPSLIQAIHKLPRSQIQWVEKEFTRYSPDGCILTGLITALTLDCAYLMHLAYSTDRDNHAVGITLALLFMFILSFCTKPLEKYSNIRLNRNIKSFSDSFFRQREASNSTHEDEVKLESINVISSTSLTRSNHGEYKS